MDKARSRVPPQNESYPTIHFLLRYRRAIVALATALFPLLGFYAGWRLGYVELPVIGVIGGAIVFVLARSYIELVALIADMLLPR